MLSRYRRLYKRTYLVSLYQKGYMKRYNLQLIIKIQPKEIIAKY